MGHRWASAAACGIVAGAVIASCALWQLKRRQITSQAAVHAAVPPAEIEGVVAFPKPPEPLPSVIYAQPPPPPAVEPLGPIVPSRRESAIGPYEVDGVNFFINLKHFCAKYDEQKHECTDDSGETVESLAIVDSSGNTQYAQVVHPYDKEDAMEVLALRLEGKTHQVLQLGFQEVPSAPETGESSDFFILREGKLVKIDKNPLGVSAITNLQKGKSLDSRKLLPDDSFVTERFESRYYRTVRHYRVNWATANLDELETDNFEVIPHGYETSEEGSVALYSTADWYTKPESVKITAHEKVKLLSEHCLPRIADSLRADRNSCWLKINVNGREGYLASDTDFDSIGLLPVN